MEGWWLWLGRWAEALFRWERAGRWGLTEEPFLALEEGGGAEGSRRWEEGGFMDGGEVFSRGGMC